jgi:hypothetical protein
VSNDAKTANTLTGKAGRVDVLQLSLPVVAIRMTRHAEAAFATFIFAALDEVIRAGAQPKFHFDCFEVTGFENAFDAAMRTGLASRRKSLAGCVVGTGNRFVAMAVSIANVVLRGFIRVAKTREEFDRARAAG